MKYYCFRCGKDFLHKGNLNQHFKKRKLCEVNYIDVSYNEIEENYEDLLECFSLISNIAEIYPAITRKLPENYPTRIKKRKKDF